MSDPDADQPPQKRRSETRYGRVPLWLYEAGVSLQAVATYGWLIGRYGHFDRISPSYATLAKELGVSRGSVIAYVKELQAVGAVRIAQSGAQGRQSNQFAIAFDAPFALESTGQHSDQSAGRPVSQLDSTGQRADPGGQPVVQEEDSSFQTKKTLSSLVPQQATEPPAPVERETVASTDKPTTAQRIVRAAGLLTANEETAFIAWVRVKHAPAAPAFWRKVEAEGDLPELVEAWRASQPMRPTLSLIPDWCGHCNRGTEPASIAERLTETTDGRIEPCRACHPKRRTAA